MRQPPKAFPSVLALLENCFKGHVVIESAGQFFLDEKADANQIYVPLNCPDRISGLYPVMHAVYDIQLYVENQLAKRNGQEKKLGKSRRLVAASRGKLQDLVGGKFQHFAPPLYHCPHCGYLEGIPSNQKYENTLRSLSGHCGIRQRCPLCDGPLGLKDGLHSFSLSGK